MNELACADAYFAYDKAGGDVLQGVSLTLAAGTLTGIVGPNGSGKSTLLRVLAGILRPRSGRVTLNGESVASLDRRLVARTIAFLPQSVSMMFGFSVREVVALGRYPHLGPFGFLSQHDVAVVDQSLAQTESTDLAHRPFMELSGGERQRALIAAILAQEPDVLCLDEPTAALDIHHQVAILSLLARLAREGRTVVVVTHDLNLAAQFCGRLAILHQGRIAREGEPPDVLDAGLLKDVYQADLVVERNPVTGKRLVVVVGDRGAE